LQLSVGEGVVRVAWMRMMGADSVDYHEHTVAGRGDDPVAASAEYYASRGGDPDVLGRFRTWAARLER